MLKEIKVGGKNQCIEQCDISEIKNMLSYIKNTLFFCVNSYGNRLKEAILFRGWIEKYNCNPLLRRMNEDVRFCIIYNGVMKIKEKYGNNHQVFNVALKTYLKVYGWSMDDLRRVLEQQAVHGFPQQISISHLNNAIMIIKKFISLPNNDKNIIYKNIVSGSYNLFNNLFNGIITMQNSITKKDGIDIMEIYWYVLEFAKMLFAEMIGIKI